MRSMDSLTPRAATPESSEAAAQPARDGPLAAVGWIALFVAVAALFQLLTPVPWDADTAYHVAVARLMREHGVLRSFPWTPFSWLADHYADKEFAFHLLLLPFARLPWVTASKIAGVIAGALALSGIYLVLRAERVQRPGLWTLLPLVASGAFAFRYALVRPHLLSIPLAILVTWAAGRRRFGYLAIACALYPLTYVGWPLAIVLAVCAEIAIAVGGGRPGLKGPAIALAGVTLGAALHPNFPEIVRLTWLADFGILMDTAWAQRTGFELGSEFRPFSFEDVLRYLLPVALLTVGAGVLAWRKRKRDALPLAFAGAALLFLGLTLRTSRFVEYLAPFAASAAALAAARSHLARAWTSLVLGGAFAYTLALGSGSVRALATRGDDIPPQFARFLRDVVPDGAQVFTCEWGLTGELMLALPERRFVVALDPVLFWRSDRALYDLWYRLPREGGLDAAERIRRSFGAQYVLCWNDPRWAPFFRALDADSSVRPLFRNSLWALYSLAPSSP